MPACALIDCCSASRSATGRSSWEGSGGPGHRDTVKSAATASAERAPITSPSSRLLEASRFAPCRPVRATSPAAYNPGTVVRPLVSVTTPPHW